MFKVLSNITIIKYLFSNEMFWNSFFSMTSLLLSDGIFFIQEDYFYKHISAVFEWLLAINLQLYELSYSVEFYFFSSSMLSVLLAKTEEEKCLILS